MQTEGLGTFQNENRFLYFSPFFLVLFLVSIADLAILAHSENASR